MGYCLLNIHAFPALHLKYISSLIDVLLLLPLLELHVPYHSLKLLQSSLLFPDLVSHSLRIVLVILHFRPEPFIFLLHFPHLSAELFLLSECPSPFSLDLGNHFLYLFSIELGLSLEGHHLFVVVACLLDFPIQLRLYPLNFLHICHAFAPFIL